MKNVIFEDEDLRQLEICHNMISMLHPNSELYISQNTKMVMVMAKMMTEIYIKVTTEGEIFHQQYILQKGLKIYKGRGLTAAENNCIKYIDTPGSTQ